MDNKVCDISIILVNYFTSSLCSNVINSIIEKSNNFTYEIIIVDNSNDSNEFSKLKELEKFNARIIDAKGNLGFGKANNLGSTFAEGKYLYFLNTDTLLINNAIYELKCFLDENDHVGIVGSNLYTKEMKPNLSYDLKEMNLKSQRTKNSLLTKFKFHVLKIRSGFNYSNKPLQVKGCVIGASLMIRKTLFDKLGGFDKDIFMYGEESLLCHRLIHELNFKIYNIPSSKIIHFEAGSQINFSNTRKIKTMLDGFTIYYYKLFGKDATIQYLQSEYKYASKKIRFFKLINNEIKVDYYKAWCDVCVEKLSQLNNNTINY